MPDCGADHVLRFSGTDPDRGVSPSQMRSKHDRLQSKMQRRGHSSLDNASPAKDGPLSPVAPPRVQVALVQNRSGTSLFNVLA